MVNIPVISIVETQAPAGPDTPFVRHPLRCPDLARSKAVSRLKQFGNTFNGNVPSFTEQNPRTPRKYLALQ